ncbi:hypothetical protein [Celerinatantimonas yamalensis]|uniref:Outer membrane protein beta-barrel domain-containing protein n=1 Tax=Celerinatantimonas yamalensis TaxID=559956 RepID=A0ABW9G4Y3_9GAMM
MHWMMQRWMICCLMVPLPMVYAQIRPSNQQPVRQPPSRVFFTEYNKTTHSANGVYIQTLPEAISGGYQQQLPRHLNWFIEAGVKSLSDTQLVDIASLFGVNLSAGIRYQPLSKLTLSGSVNQHHYPDTLNHNDAVSMRVAGTYLLYQQFELNAHYAFFNPLPLQDTNQFGLDLHYNF